MLPVEPVAHKGFASGRFALRDFIFVVREREVDAAGVNVQRFAEILHGHGRAFDVPAGTAAADGRFPEMLPGLGRLPEGKIASAFFFVAIVIHARAGLNAAEVNPGKLAIIWEFGDAVVDRALARVSVRFLL